MLWCVLLLLLLQLLQQLHQIRDRMLGKKGLQHVLQLRCQQLVWSSSFAKAHGLVRSLRHLGHHCCRSGCWAVQITASESL